MPTGTDYRFLYVVLYNKGKGYSFGISNESKSIEQMLIEDNYEIIYSPEYDGDIIVGKKNGDVIGVVVMGEEWVDGVDVDDDDIPDITCDSGPINTCGMMLAGQTPQFYVFDASAPLVVLGSGSNFSPPPLTTTTIYTVTFTSDVSSCIATADVVITVNPVPTVTLIAIPNPACIGNDIILTANPSAGSSYRFQYNSGSGWTNLTNPGYGLLNPVTFSNISTTTQFRVKVREYNGCPNSSWSPIITVPITSITTSLIPSSLQMYCQNTPVSNLTVIVNGGIVPYQYQWYEYSSPNQSLSA